VAYPRVMVDDGMFNRSWGSFNGRENTCYRQATLFCRFVRGEGGMKQRGWIKERKEREKQRERERERERTAGIFCSFFNEILERFDRQ